MQHGFILGDRRLGAFALLQVIAQRGLFHRQGSLGLMHPLFIDAIVYLEQHLARLDNREIFDVDGGDIAVDLRANKGGLPAHIGVVGKLAMASERRQLPGVEDHQHADEAYRRGGKNGNHANIIPGVGLLFGRILLTHNDSRDEMMIIICCR